MSACVGEVISGRPVELLRSACAAGGAVAVVSEPPDERPGRSGPTPKMQPQDQGDETGDTAVHPRLSLGIRLPRTSLTADVYGSATSSNCMGSPLSVRPRLPHCTAPSIG